MRVLIVLALVALFALGGYICYEQQMNAGPRRESAMEQIAYLSMALQNHDDNPSTVAAPILPALDPWGTPLAVVGKESAVVNGQTIPRDESGLWRDWPYQIVSAGPDRVFGTADDVRSFDPTR